MAKKNSDWVKWQTRRNKINVIYYILAIFFILMMILILFGVFTESDLKFWK